MNNVLWKSLYFKYLSSTPLFFFVPRFPVLVIIYCTYGIVWVSYARYVGKERKKGNLFQNLSGINARLIDVSLLKKIFYSELMVGSPNFSFS